MGEKTTTEKREGDFQPYIFADWVEPHDTVLENMILAIFLKTSIGWMKVQLPK